MPTASQREIFVGLLRELRATGPLGRLRLLGRGVAALRQLSPWDRKVLLRMAGFEGAESLIERLAAEDGETAERLQRVLAEIERDPKRAEATVRALSDPHQRGEAIESLVDLLDRANHEDAPPPAPPASPPAPPPPSLPEDAPVPELPGASVPAPPIPAPRAPSARPAPSEPARPATAAAPPSPPAAKAEAESENRAKPVEPAAAPPPAPERRVLPEPEPAKPETPARPTPPELSDLSSGLLVERSARGVLHALLDLRRRLEAGESVPGEALRALLADEGLPAWARRRAVTAWIEARRPDAESALEVIGELGSAGDRKWCLGALAASRRWSPAAWEKILEAAPDGPARRRLARRRAA